MPDLVALEPHSRVQSFKKKLVIERSDMGEKEVEKMTGKSQPSSDAKKTLENQNSDIILRRQAIEKAKDAKSDEVRKSQVKLQGIKENIELLQRRVASCHSSVHEMRRNVERERQRAHERNIGLGIGIGVASVFTFGIAGAAAAGVGMSVVYCIEFGHSFLSRVIYNNMHHLSLICPKTMPN